MVGAEAVHRARAQAKCGHDHLFGTPAAQQRNHPVEQRIALTVAWTIGIGAELVACIYGAPLHGLLGTPMIPTSS